MQAAKDDRLQRCPRCSTWNPSANKICGGCNNNSSESIKVYNWLEPCKLCTPQQTCQSCATKVNGVTSPRPSDTPPVVESVVSKYVEPFDDKLLPPDVLHRLCGYFQISDKIHLMCSCKHFYESLNTLSFWKNEYNIYWSQFDSIRPLSQVDSIIEKNWKDVFLQKWRNSIIIRVRPGVYGNFQFLPDGYYDYRVQKITPAGDFLQIIRNRFGNGYFEPEMRTSLETTIGANGIQNRQSYNWVTGTVHDHLSLKYLSKYD